MFYLKKKKKDSFTTSTWCTLWCLFLFLFSPQIHVLVWLGIEAQDREGGDERSGPTGLGVRGHRVAQRHHTGYELHTLSAVYLLQHLLEVHLGSFLSRWCCCSCFCYSSDQVWSSVCSCVDVVGKRLYWVDSKLRLISSVDFNGAQRRVILSSSERLSHPYTLAVFEVTVCVCVSWFMFPGRMVPIEAQRKSKPAMRRKPDEERQRETLHLWVQALGVLRRRLSVKGI